MYSIVPDEGYLWHAADLASSFLRCPRHVAALAEDDFTPRPDIMRQKKCP